MDSHTRCAGIKRDGGRCTQSVEEGQPFCHHHDPDRAQERKQNASKAASSRHQDSELSSVRRRLKELAESVLDGRMSTAKASVASQVFGVYLRAVEQERKQKELEELATRVAELEITLESQRQEGGSWYVS
jgi:cytidylate kinase